MASSGGQASRSVEVITPDLLLRLGALIAASLAVFHLGLGAAFGAAGHLVGALLFAGFSGVLLASSMRARRSRGDAPILAAGGALVILSLGLAFLVPGTNGLVLLAPVVLVALAMSYVTRSRWRGLTVVSWVIGILAVLALQLDAPFGLDTPESVRFVVGLVHTAVGLGLVLFLLWQFSSRLEDAIETMGAANTELVEAREANKRANGELRRQVQELELRNRESKLVGHMGSLLEVSHTAEEAYTVIANAARLLFPGLSGSLLVLPDNRLVVERVATWGVEPEERRIFGPEDCWAIRQGRLYIVDSSDTGPICAHVAATERRPYMCIPLTAQGATLGVFHLLAQAPDTQPDVEAQRTLPRRQGRTADGRLTESARSLGLWMAELLALSLANFRLRETLRAQSTRDPLTGLFNRRYMEDSLERELYRAAREQGSLGVIMADLDHFKELNDRSGHVAGDAVLRSVADLLHNNVRAEDIVCRYGGEEFTILLPNAGLEEARSRAEALRIAAAGLSIADGHVLTISLGVAAYPDHGTTATDLISAADAALYEAKSLGRDRVVAAEPR
jgi:diguanylate cyclase (GGDEF)-like protein